MQFVSYAQNAEDVVLKRALKDVSKGFYIDVGAYDPLHDSVTKLFYDNGWRGINVEPCKEYHERFVVDRPRDLNLNVVASAECGTVSFYNVFGTGLSSVDFEVAESARERGFDVERRDIEALTLAEIYRRSEVEVVHFLKIDVEGGERLVLEGADFTTFRPWIVVVEATLPNASERNDGTWRHLLENAGYECTLFDGLNLFFLAQEHSELRGALSVPANVHDAFLPIQLHAAMLRLAEIRDGQGGTMPAAGNDIGFLDETLSWHRAYAQAVVQQSIGESIAWHRADAESQANAAMDETIAWHRADAESQANAAMDETIAWHRADAESQVKAAMGETIAWHRADAERRARAVFDETIAWHRADAAGRALTLMEKTLLHS